MRGGGHERYFEAEGVWIVELWNAPEDEAASIARARVEAGTTTRWHQLHGITERYLLLEGEGHVDVGDAPPRHVRPGDVVVIPPGVRQRIRSADTGDLVFLAICTPRFRIEAYQSLDD